MNAICDELHSQLDSWYSSMPEAFRPELDVMQTLDDRQATLRTRYFATRHIIYRPFVLYIVTHGGEQIAEDIISKAIICIESCRSYIHSTKQLLAKPSQYTWTFALSYVKMNSNKKEEKFNYTLQLTGGYCSPHFVLAQSYAAGNGHRHR